MGEATQIGCACGQTHLEVEGRPIASVECCCNSKWRRTTRRAGDERSPHICPQADGEPRTCDRSTPNDLDKQNENVAYRDRTFTETPVKVRYGP
jgi:hypothetical protein